MSLAGIRFFDFRIHRALGHKLSKAKNFSGFFQTPREWQNRDQGKTKSGSKKPPLSCCGKKTGQHHGVRQAALSIVEPTLSLSR
jgi:hypothetical protein